jgi:hypothetical protein
MAVERHRFLGALADHGVYVIFDPESAELIIIGGPVTPSLVILTDPVPLSMIHGVCRFAGINPDHLSY